MEKEYVGNFTNIQINNGKVYIDGKLKENFNDSHKIELIIKGNVGEINTDCSVNCDDVLGNIKAGGSVNCDDVSGDVVAGGSVNCDNVGGNVIAKRSINMG